MIATGSDKTYCRTSNRSHPVESIYRPNRLRPSILALAAGLIAVPIQASAAPTLPFTNNPDNVVLGIGAYGDLFGGDGDDYLEVNGATINSYHADAGNDTIVMNSGVITSGLYGHEGAGGTEGGTLGNDTFIINGGTIGGNGFGHAIEGGLGDDYIEVNGGVLNGNLIAGEGNDDHLISGGLVNGTVFIGNEDTFTMTGGEITGSIIGNNGPDIGGETVSITSGSIGGDINGAGGNDTITVSGGTLGGSIFGGDGNDSIVLSGTPNIPGIVDGGADNDTLTVNGSVDLYAAPPNGFLIGGSGNDTITVNGGSVGNLYGDANPFVDFFGGSADNIFINGGLVDGLHGQGGDDLIVINGGIVQTKINSGTGSDTIQILDGTVGTIDAYDGDDIIVVDGGIVSGEINARQGNDTIQILSGQVNNSIYGDASFSSETGDDTILLSGGTVQGDIRGGSGNDQVILQAGHSVTGILDGGDDTDSLTFDGAGSDSGTFTNFENLSKTGIGDWISDSVLSMSTTSVSVGNLFIDGSLTSPNITVASSAGFGGSGTIIGDVTSSGTLIVTSADLELTGDVVFTSGSTLAVGAVGNSFHRLAASGTVDIAPASTVTIADLPAADFAAIVLTSNGLTGLFDTVTDGNGDELSQAFVSAINGTDVLVGRLPIRQAATQAAASLSDLNYRSFIGSVQDRFDEDGRVWVLGFGGISSQEPEDNILGYDMSNIGGAVGFGHSLTEHLLIGWAASAANAGADINSNTGEVELQSYFGSIYSTYQNSGYQFSLIATGGRNSFDGSRLVTDGASTSTASDSSDGSLWSLRAELSKGIHLDHGSTLRPSLAVEHRSERYDGFQGDGGGLIPELNVESHQPQELRYEGHVDWAFGDISNAGMPFEFSVRAGVAHEQYFGDSEVQVAFAGADSGLALSLGSEDRTSGLVGGFVKYGFSDRGSAQLGFRSEIADDFQHHNIFAGITFDW